jgi:hypothetical protein
MIFTREVSKAGLAYGMSIVRVHHTLIATSFTGIYRMNNGSTVSTHADSMIGYDGRFTAERTLIHADFTRTGFIRIMHGATVRAHNLRSDTLTAKLYGIFRIPEHRRSTLSTPHYVPTFTVRTDDVRSAVRFTANDTARGSSYHVGRVVSYTILKITRVELLDRVAIDTLLNHRQRHVDIEPFVDIPCSSRIE